METDEKEPKTISIPTWWKPGGGMMYNRDFLPANHPEQTYNYVKNVLGVRPEDYGVYRDESEVIELREKSKEELIAEVISLREQIKGYESAGF